MTDYDTISKNSIKKRMFNFAFINQFMLYLDLDTITRNDYNLILLIFTNNTNLEFKHIIHLILIGEIEVTEGLRKNISSNEKFKWCKDIERDFEYESVY